MVKSSTSTTAAPLMRIKQRHLSQLAKGKGKKGHKDRPTTNIKLSIPELDRIMSGRMLNDGLINAASKMLHKQFPHVRDLQSLIFGESLSF